MNWIDRNEQEPDPKEHICILVWDDEEKHPLNASYSSTTKTWFHDCFDESYYINFRYWMQAPKSPYKDQK